MKTFYTVVSGLRKDRPLSSFSHVELYVYGQVSWTLSSILYRVPKSHEILMLVRLQEVPKIAVTSQKLKKLMILVIDQNDETGLYI